MLASDAHGGFGGIAQYNRDVIEAMSGFAKVDEIVVVPRVMSEERPQLPGNVRYVHGSSGELIRYIGHSLAEAMLGGRYDLVYCAHINLLPVAAVISRMRRLPLALAIYGTDAWRRPAGWLIAKFVRTPDLILSISRLTLDRFLSWSSPSRAATAIVPNAIRTADYGVAEPAEDLVARYGLAGRKVIMTLGRMAAAEQAKGFDEIISLMPRLRQAQPDIVYLCAGDGDDRPRLEEKARALGLTEAVIFTGRVPDERKADYYRLADAYVMPSRWEGFGFVIIEALACGIPVVASAADGTREAVRGGELGAVVDPDDASALERAILNVLQKPKRVPPGLEYFSFANFQKRLHAALSLIVAI